jgi:hypothetical protein
MSGRKKTQDEQPDLQADEQVTQPEATEGLDEAEAGGRYEVNGEIVNAEGEPVKKSKKDKDDDA